VFFFLYVMIIPFCSKEEAGSTFVLLRIARASRGVGIGNQRSGIALSQFCWLNMSGDIFQLLTGHVSKAS
jgi:hypothetical protein